MRSRWRSRVSAIATARARRSTMSASRLRRGAFRDCSGSTARARGRCFSSSPGCSACTHGEALRCMGVVFQPRTLDLDLSVMQNLLYHAALHGINRREARTRSDEVLSRMGLADRPGSKVRDLSGGQMRRLEVARALLHRPRLLLLDEATVGLDVKARAEILGHVRGLVIEQGIGVLWATHLFDEIVPSDDLVILHQGRILAEGKVARIVTKAGGRDLHSAFVQLTETGPGSEGDMP